MCAVRPKNLAPSHIIHLARKEKKKPYMDQKDHSTKKRNHQKWLKNSKKKV